MSMVSKIAALLAVALLLVGPTAFAQTGGVTDTTEITVFGQHFATHTGSFPPLSYVDLSFSRAWAQPPAVLADALSQAEQAT